MGSREPGEREVGGGSKDRRKERERWHFMAPSVAAVLCWQLSLKRAKGREWGAEGSEANSTSVQR